MALSAAQQTVIAEARACRLREQYATAVEQGDTAVATELWEQIEASGADTIGNPA